MPVMGISSSEDRKGTFLLSTQLKKLYAASLSDKEQLETQHAALQQEMVGFFLCASREPRYLIISSVTIMCLALVRLL